MERIKLTITEVGEEASGDRSDGKGQWHRLACKGKSGADEHWYQTFRDTLFSTIRESFGKEIDCEVDVKETPQGTNRTIQQIYKDGQPVGGQKKQWGKSPENLKMELDAKAKNTALMQAVEIAKWSENPKGIGDILDVAQSLYDWLVGIPAQGKKSSDRPVAKPPVEPAEQASRINTDTVIAKDVPLTFTKDSLLAKVCEARGFRVHKTAVNFLIGKCGISEERINNDPGGVYNEVKEML